MSVLQQLLTGLFSGPCCANTFVTNSVGVNSVLPEQESVFAAAALGDVGEQTPVHEDVPGEGVGGGDHSSHHPQTKEQQVHHALVQERQPHV